MLEWETEMTCLVTVETNLFSVWCLRVHMRLVHIPYLNLTVSLGSRFLYPCGTEKEASACPM